MKVNENGYLPTVLAMQAILANLNLYKYYVCNPLQLPLQSHKQVRKFLLLVTAM